MNFDPPDDNKKIEKKGIRVVTFNVHFGKKVDSIVKTFQDNPILREADIIYFQEIEDHKEEKLPRAQKIADELSFECVYAPARKLTKLNVEGTHGLAILSRYPILEAEFVALPKNKMYPRSRERIGLNATVQINEEFIHLSNVHLDTRLNSMERIEQLRVLIEGLKAHTLKKVILGGDFNTLPFNFYKTIPISREDQKKILHEYLRKENFFVYGENIKQTFENGLISWDLDGLYLRNIKALQYGVEQSVRVSDHKPVWLDVEI